MRIGAFEANWKAPYEKHVLARTNRSESHPAYKHNQVALNLAHDLGTALIAFCKGAEHTKDWNDRANAWMRNTMALFLGIRHNTPQVDAQKVIQVMHTGNEFKLEPKKFNSDAECISNYYSIVFDVTSASFDKGLALVKKNGVAGELIESKNSAATSKRNREDDAVSGNARRPQPGARVPGG